MLAWRLIFRADDDSAQIEQDCPDAHLLFFFPLEALEAAGVFLAGGFLPNSDLEAGLGLPAATGFASGLGLVAPLLLGFAATGSG